MRALRRSKALLRLPLRQGGAGGSPWAVVAIEVVLVAGAVCSALAPGDVAFRAAAAAVLVAIAAAVDHLSWKRGRPAKAWLVLDEQGMHKVEGVHGAAQATTMLAWREPFGATVFGSADRATFLIALTSPRATRLVSVRAPEGAGCAPTLLERASPAPDSYLRPREEPVLGVSDAERLLRELARRAPAALDRVYLSDACGAPVVLDRSELRVGARRIDLSSPLESRAFVFHESGAHSASVCQATWVRQSDAEVVLVSPMAAEGGWPQASVGEPPPRELRLAIERLFMLPLRRAIDRAPRVSRAAPSASRRTDRRA